MFCFLLRALPSGYIFDILLYAAALVAALSDDSTCSIVLYAVLVFMVATLVAAVINRSAYPVFYTRLLLLGVATFFAA